MQAMLGRKMQQTVTLQQKRDDKARVKGPCLVEEPLHPSHESNGCLVSAQAGA